MGQDVKIKTEKIFNAYLTLGLLEINKTESDNTFLSQTNIWDKLGVETIAQKNYIGRYLNNIEQWLSDAGLANDQIAALIERKTYGFKLKNNIPAAVHKDFLGSFLYLNLIEDKEHEKNLDELMNKEGERPLSLISKLVIAKKSQKFLKIEYENSENELEYKPEKFSYDNNVWCVIGSLKNAIKTGKIKLELSKIKKIS